MAVQRAYWWTFLIYDESAPKDWFDVLESSGAQISYIYHDKDVLDRDVYDGKDKEIILHKKGEPKKPHYHILVRWNTAKSWKQMYSYFSCLGTSHFEVVKTPSHAYLYLTHETDKSIKDKKHLYPASDILFINSCRENFEALCRISNKSSDTGDLVECFEIIQSNIITEMCDFINFCLENSRLDLIEVASGRQGYILTSYITSFRNKLEKYKTNPPKQTLLNQRRK